MSLTVTNQNQAAMQIVASMCDVPWDVADGVISALPIGSRFTAPVAGTVHLMNFTRTCPATVNVTWLTSA